MSDDRPGGDEPRTVFSPGPAPPRPEPRVDLGAVPPPAPASANQPRRVQVGDVLNHLYRVVRFIDAGGMGEVFEGVNISQDDERVAIKVILPHLAADPNVFAMFRKEARTLTRLSHPALVQYRTLAQEPQLGALYIATEYIDGTNLSKVLSTVDASPEAIRALIRRLAEGLAAAHALGAIHRDISPDNVMLEQGRLDRAKIIDFGIAKDLDAGSQTIVGDGFAGKLNYVAPEQLGDFGREVGEWTDVYSLGLTILAIFNRRDVNMGGTLVDAVDKRRAGPDLSCVPPALRPVLEGMLRPNPKDRLRSMQDVIGALSAPVPSPREAAAPPAGAPSRAGSGTGPSRRMLMAGGGIAGAALLATAIGIGLSSGGGNEATPANVVAEVAPPPRDAPPPADPVGTAQAALAAGLRDVACSWLDAADISANGAAVDAAFRGVSGRPGQAQGQIGQMLAASGLRAATLDFGDVSPIDPGACDAIDAFRAVRADGSAHITTAQRKYEMDVLPEGASEAGKLGATAVLEIDLTGVPGDIALIGLQDDGRMAQFVASRSELGASTRPDVYRIQADTTHKGWSGIVLVSGKGPFDTGLPKVEPAPMPTGWAQRFLSQATARGWKAEMVWYRLVDEVPNRAR